MKSRKKLVRILIFFISTLFCTAAATYVGRSAIGQWLELRTYDLRFKLRGPLPQSEKAPVTLIAIDEEAFQQIPDPVMLWHGTFARAIDYLVSKNVAAIGIDFLFADIRRFDPEGERRLSASLIQAGAAGVPVVLVYRIRPDGLEQPTEAVRFAALAAGHELAYANLTTDSDDFVRRQEIFGVGDDKEPRRGLALALADAYAKKNNFQVAGITDPIVLINYRGARHFKRISFARILRAAEKGEALSPGEDLQGRIVLIGRVGLAGDEDLHSTPQYFSPVVAPGESVRTPGVEIHANVITTLLENSAIRTVSPFRQLMITLALVVVVSVFCYRLSLFVALPASFAAVLSFLAIAMLYEFQHGWWIQVLPPILGAFLAIGAAEIANYWTEGREKRQLRSLFKRYVNDQVIEKILESTHSLVLAGERKLVTVLFADIRGFTTRSERAPAEVIVSDLNEYFTAMVSAIQKRGGMVDKFIGDGIMAIFGAPVDDPDSARHAIEAAHDMVLELAEVNRRLAARGSQPIAIGIGLHSGEALVGNIGSAQKMEYTAIGDVVNVASRIEGRTKEHKASILISGETLRAAGEGISAKYIGKELLKGRAEPIEIYRV